MYFAYFTILSALDVTCPFDFSHSSGHVVHLNILIYILQMNNDIKHKFISFAHFLKNAF